MFEWLKDVKIPVFGICGGFQVVGMTFGGVLASGEEIGYYPNID